MYSAVAVGLLLLFGIGHRRAAGHLSRAEGSVRLTRGSLAALPALLGEWNGKDVPLDERVVRATDTDDHVHRVYSLPSGQSATLYLAYGVRMRDLMPHRPEVCYPSAGWIFDGKKQVEIRSDSGEVRPVQLIRFRPGGLETGPLTVLNYYVVNGRHCPDVSLLRSQAWRVGTELAYAAQVQIAATADPIHGGAEESVIALAAVAAPAVEALLLEVVGAHSASDRSRE